jgi:hypothetical protein
MANGDAALVGLTTRSTSTTNVQRLPPPDPDAFVGPGISANGVLVGWNSSAIGDGVVGRAAPGAAGVRGIVNPRTPPVAGEVGVFGLAQLTGILGTATTPATVSPNGTVVGGTGAAGSATMGGVGVHGRAASGSATEFGVVGSSGTGTGVAGFSGSARGVVGSSNSGDGVVGGSNSGVGVRGASSSGDGVVGVSGSGNAGVRGRTLGNGVGVIGEGFLREGVIGETQGENAGVMGHSVRGPGVSGVSDEWYGVLGRSVQGGGVLGITESTDMGVAGVARAGGIGVNGQSKDYLGVFAYSDENIALYARAPNSVAVKGDGGAAGIFGSTQRGVGIVAASDTGFGLFARTRSATNPAGFFQGNVVIQGNLIVSGNKNAAVPRAGGKHQLLYCLESPESWLEDFGEARLVNGRARIRIDPDYRNTIDTRSYHVFVSAYGPDPVFVSNRSRNGFEIRVAPREGAGMPRSLRCSYRIVARRRSVKAPRLKQIQLPSIPEFVPEVEAKPSRIHGAELRQRLNRLGAASEAAREAPKRRRAEAALEPTVPTKPPVFPRPPKIVARDKPRGRRKTARST